ncbi:MAG: hypothetical protein IJW29_02125 [Clostridia bacterium]|nr:hypothetical protein [Clostridia bacterium]
MPSNDERREVAARLRKLEEENHWEKSRFIVGFIEALGLETRANVGECLLRLADLIEPEERTCHVVSTIQREYYIEGQVVFEYETKLSCGHKFSDDYGDAPNYCPNCGLRVIE